MSNRGRPKQPAKVKQMKGTHQKCRDEGNVESLAPMVNIPHAPAYLKKPAKDLWVHKCRVLLANGLLDRMDLELLELYCLQWQIAQDAARMIKKEGYTVLMTNKAGYSYDVKSPYISILNDATAKVHSIGAHFGFTPSSRARIKAPENKPASKLLNMVKGGL